MANTHQLLIDLEWLKTSREWDKDDLHELEDYSRMVAAHEAYLVLQDNPVIQARVQRMKDAIVEIDESLSNDRALQETDRQYLFAKKDVYKEELALLGVDLEENVEEIAGLVTEKLSRYRGNNI